jgi:serine/threonine-protein kinase
VILAGRYELGEVLGRGGMGVVYRARDLALERVVAVKCLPATSADDPVAVARFQREALAAAALTHPNIVTVFDAGLDGVERFIVMECVAGRSLDRVLRESGALEWRSTVSVGRQVASALAAAHQAGIVHRDIKPGNVMLDGTGTVKVLDFGIARLAGGATLTQTATVLGSAHYLAPELAHGAEADARSDIYALGCVLYELLTGAPPFAGDQPVAVLAQHMSASPRPPCELVPAVPVEVSELVMRLLAKDPAQRQADAAELEAELAELAQSIEPQTAVTRVQTLVMPVAGAGAAELASTVPLRTRAAAAARLPRRVIAAGTLLAAVVALTLTGLLVGGGGRRAVVAARVRPRAQHHVRARRRRTASHTAVALTSTTTATTTTGTTAAPASTQSTPAQQHGPPAQQHGPPGQQNGGPGQQNGPPGQQNGGPHAGGLPPGQARKLGPPAQ